MVKHPEPSVAHSQEDKHSNDPSHQRTGNSHNNEQNTSTGAPKKQIPRTLHKSIFSEDPITPPTNPGTGPPDTMSKLSPALKQLINAPFARPSYTVPNASSLRPLLSKLAEDASSHNVSAPAWLTFSTATAMTMNAPSAMTLIWDTAQKHDRTLSPIITAELQREVGLKCISFNGIPRSINCLGAFYNQLPADVRSKLSTKPTRQFSPTNIEDRKSDGLGLWDSVYYGFERKLLDKLAQSHPDLPVHIINGHYANLLSNPSRGTYIDGKEKPKETHVGRVLTSLLAISCLRAQTGVGPQVISHIFGLRKAYERGDAEKQGEVDVRGGEWLSTEEGNKWLLGWIDQLIRGIGTAQEGDQDTDVKGTSFAPGLGSNTQAKL